MEEIRKEIRDRLLLAAKRVSELGQEELRKQGHRSSGRLENSFRVELLKMDTNKIVVGVIARHYGIVLDTGVKASRVPYTSSGIRRGGTSAYIEGLLEWALIAKPNLNEKERRSFVFAVARKASDEGHPTSGSLYFSSTGKRVGWINDTISKNENKILGDLGLGELIKKDILNAIIALALPNITVKRI